MPPRSGELSAAQEPTDRTPGHTSARVVEAPGPRATPPGSSTARALPPRVGSAATPGPPMPSTAQPDDVQTRSRPDVIVSATVGTNEQATPLAEATVTVKRTGLPATSAASASPTAVTEVSRTVPEAQAAGPVGVGGGEVVPELGDVLGDVLDDVLGVAEDEMDEGGAELGSFEDVADGLAGTEVDGDGEADTVGDTTGGLVVPAPLAEALAAVDGLTRDDADGRGPGRRGVGGTDARALATGATGAAETDAAAAGARPGSASATARRTPTRAVTATTTATVSRRRR